MTIYDTLYFIERANQVHKFKYIYFKTIYINSKQDVIVICPIHGEFLITPNEHLANHGCKKCAILNRAALKTKDTAWFISKAIEIHGNIYDYSLSEYTHSKQKVKIICKIHGIFEQIPNSHLMGKGCARCRDMIFGVKQLSNTKEFIKRAQLVHIDDNYDYSLVEYINSKLKVNIICPHHGVFAQTPDAHLQGQGCPTCKKSIGELLVKKYLEENKILFEPQYWFPNCRNINPLLFDFGILNETAKLVAVIEYQGSQHYETNSRFGGETGLVYRQKNDKIKFDYCESNNIPLLLIPYWRQKHVSKILSDFISTLKF